MNAFKKGTTHCERATIQPIIPKAVLTDFQFTKVGIVAIITV